MRAAESGQTWQPALDGVRGCAVTLVVLFHAGFSWMSGGYLGVSVFFTLSGFLITRLLLAEHASAGRIAYGQFAARRIRRLLPASAMCLVGVMVARALGEFDGVVGLRSDLVGALAQVFNWVRLTGSGSYGDLFAGVSAATVSPLEHYWSLAIEEQFYLVWPLAVVVILTLNRRGRASRPRERSVAVAITMVTVAFALLAPIIAAVFGPDAAYWATPARLAEILMGATAAAWMAAGHTVPATASRLATPMLVAITLAAVWLPSGSGPAYAGWLPVCGVMSALLIIGLQVPGRIVTLLSSRPVVWLGSVSYGVYLFHWPVFTIARQHDWVLTDPVPFGLAVGCTLGLAWLSATTIERPVRSRHWNLSPTLGFATVVVVMVAVAISTIPETRPLVAVTDAVFTRVAITPTKSIEALAARPQSATAADVTTVVTTVVAAGSTDTLPVRLALAPVPSRPTRLLVVGDSTALAFAHGLAVWAAANPQYATVSVVAREGFGVLLTGTITTWDGSNFIASSRQMIETDVPAAVESLQPDVVIVMTTVDDVTDRRWNDDEGDLSPMDPASRSRLATAYYSYTQRLITTTDAVVVWVVPPIPTTQWESRAMRDPERYETQHRIIRGLLSVAGVRVFDLEAWMMAQGFHHDSGWRPDGTHLSASGSLQLASQVAGPWLVNVALAGR